MYCSLSSLIAYFTKFICVCYRINLTGGQWKKAVKRKSINQLSRVAAGIIVHFCIWITVCWTCLGLTIRNLQLCWGQSQVISDDSYKCHHIAGLQWLFSLVVTVLSVVFPFEEGHIYFTLAWTKYFVIKCLFDKKKYHGRCWYSKLWSNVSWMWWIMTFEKKKYFLLIFLKQRILLFLPLF